MLPLNISARTIQRILIILVAIAVTAGLIWGIVYFVTHGRIVIKALEGTAFSSFSYCMSDNCNVVSNSASSSVITQRGTYMVQVSLSNNTSYVANVQVNGFLQTTVVEAKSKKYIPSTVTATSSQYILPIGDGFMTYDPDGAVYSTTSSSTIPLAKLVTTQTIDKGRILFVEYKEPTEVTSVSQKVLLYDSNSGQFSTIGELNDIDSSRVVHGSNTLYVFRAGSSSTALAVSANGITELTLPDTVTYATNNGVPILSGNDQYFAVLSGNNYASRAEGDEERTTNPSVLTLYDTSFTTIRTIPFGTRSDISNVSFSPDGSVIAVIAEDTIATYSTKTGEKIFETRAQNLAGSSVVWRDNNSFVYQLGIGGVYMANISSKEAYSILDNSLLRITDISAIVGDKVYITAFPNKSDNYDRVDPSGYSIDLSRDAASAASVQDTSILRFLPYDGITFSIGYHFDKDSAVVLDISGSEGARNAAVQKIDELGFDAGEYTIVFRGFTNPFIKTEGGNQ